VTKHLRALLQGQKSYARLSTHAGAETCIVFVHGFFGNVTTTWEYFPDLCDNENVPGADILEQSDLYFFDYPAHKAFVKESANRLAQFLGCLFPEPAMDLFYFREEDRRSIREPWLAYRRLLLVGHSLGAVVVRECIENQFRAFSSHQPPPWISICEIRLFAAAHLGFKPSGFKELLFKLAPREFTSLPAIWRAYSDLQSTSSVLVDLKKRTEKLAAVRPELKCTSALLLYGTREDVVVPGDFDCDYTIEWQDDSNHTQVCKPAEDFTNPLRFITRNAHSDQASA
jgi:pimeloyl-ACP methyl ester carboxylesterase